MGRYTQDVVDGAGGRATGHVLAVQAGAAISDTTRNELSYRMTEGGPGRPTPSPTTCRSSEGRTPSSSGGCSSTRPRGTATRPTRRTGGASASGQRSTSACATPRGASVRGWASPGSRGRGRRWWCGAASASITPRGRSGSGPWGSGGRSTTAARSTSPTPGRGKTGRPNPARYDGLRATFRHEGPKALVDISYALTHNRPPADRTHVFTASWIRDLGGWRIAGITTFQSGPPRRRARGRRRPAAPNR